MVTFFYLKIELTFVTRRTPNSTGNITMGTLVFLDVAMDATTLLLRFQARSLQPENKNFTFQKLVFFYVCLKRDLT